MGKNYDGDQGSQYFRLRYNGRTVREFGRAAVPKALDGSNDVKLKNAEPGVLLDFRNGIGVASGTFFDDLNVSPLSLGSYRIPYANLVTQVGIGTGSDHPVEIAGGLQSIPLHPLTLLRAKGIANWLTVGVDGTRRSQDGGTSESLNANYRAYAAFATWKRLPSEQKRKGFEEWNVANVPTWAKAQVLFEKVPDDAEVSPKEVARIAYNIYNERRNSAHQPGDDAGWQAELDQVVSAELTTQSYVPALRLYGEAQGQYGLSKEVLVRRYNSLWAVGLSYDLRRTSDGQSLSLDVRYEHGYNRRRPDQRDKRPDRNDHAEALKANCALAAGWVRMRCSWSFERWFMNAVEGTRRRSPFVRRSSSPTYALMPM